MAACPLAPPAVPAPLVQIRRGYATDYCGLRLSAESDADGWRAQVVSEGGRLYAARRCSLGAAKIAAAEFALWSAGMAAKSTPETMARHLSWREYW